MLQVVERTKEQHIVELVVDVSVLMQLQFQQSLPYENVKVPQIQFIVRVL